MCHVQEGFRLCTCEDQVVDPDWVLERRNRQTPTTVMMGSIAMPTPLSKAEALSRETLLSGLNPAAPTDFDYAAVLGDVLKVKVGMRWLMFRYEKTLFRAPRWRAIGNQPFSEWSQQMEPLRKGKLDC